MKAVAEHIAGLVVAIKNCRASGNSEWEHRHEARLKAIVAQFLPSGSGFDTGCFVHITNSTDAKLVIPTEFHHMDENGCYDGWTKHVVIAKASFAFGIDIEVTGRDRNDIKNYIAETFHEALSHKISTEAIDTYVG